MVYTSKIMNILKLYKNRGETPLECINRFKKENPEYQKEKMTYAGRLDPLAEGLLLVLVGEECKNKPPHQFWLCLTRNYLRQFIKNTHQLFGKRQKNII